MSSPEKFEKKVWEPAKEEKLGLTPEDKELVLDIINQPVVQKGLAKYKIFSEAYFERKDEFKEVKKEEIKQRADELFGEDDNYQDILKLERAVENEDFIKYIVAEFRGRLSELRKAKVEGKFEEVFKRILIQKYTKEYGWTEVGKMAVEIDNEICRPHLPRVAKNMSEAYEAMKESFKLLAGLLQTDKKYKNINKLEGFSWLFNAMGQEFKNFGWHDYLEGDIEGLRKENPEVYKDAQKTGTLVSPRLFKRYLLTGEMPAIGGGWITKEEFIKKMETL